MFPWLQLAAALACSVAAASASVSYSRLGYGACDAGNKYQKFEVDLGLGRILALHYCSSTLHQIR